MRCFNHAEIHGVAICKSCGRALCHDCVVEIGTATACKGRCEAAVARQNDIIERSQSVYPKTASTYVRTGVFVILMGAAFSWLGLDPILDGRTSSANYVFVALGILFVCWGFMQFWVAKKWRAK
jgi:hypothetical protein